MTVHLRMTSRERVRRAITFQSPDRIPRIHGLPEAAYAVHGDRLRELVHRYPSDFDGNGWQPGADSPQPQVLSDTDSKVLETLTSEHRWVSAYGGRLFERMQWLYRTGVGGIVHDA